MQLSPQLFLHNPCSSSVQTSMVMIGSSGLDSSWCSMRIWDQYVIEWLPSLSATVIKSFYFQGVMKKFQITVFHRWIVMINFQHDEPKSFGSGQSPTTLSTTKRRHIPWNIEETHSSIISKQCLIDVQSWKCRRSICLWKCKKIPPKMYFEYIIVNTRFHSSPIGSLCSFFIFLS